MARPQGTRFSARERQIHVPLPAWTASATVIAVVAGPPRHAEFATDRGDRWRVVRAEILTRTVPVGGGTLLVNVFVRDKSEGAAPGTRDQIVTSFDAEALVALTQTNVPFAAETSEKERTISDGDFFEVDIVASGTVTTNWAAFSDAQLVLTLLPLDIQGETFGQTLL